VGSILNCFVDVISWFKTFKTLKSAAFYSLRYSANHIFWKPYQYYLYIFSLIVVLPEFNPKLLSPRIWKESRLIRLYFEITVSKAILFILLTYLVQWQKHIWAKFQRFYYSLSVYTCHLLFKRLKTQNNMIILINADYFVNMSHSCFSFDNCLIKFLHWKLYNVLVMRTW